MNREGATTLDLLYLYVFWHIHIIQKELIIILSVPPVVTVPNPLSGGQLSNDFVIFTISFHKKVIREGNISEWSGLFYNKYL